MNKKNDWAFGPHNLFQNKIRSIIAAVILCSINSYALPHQWDVFFFQAKETQKTVTPQLKNGKLQLPGKKSAAAVKVKSANNFFDFDKLTKGNNHAVLVTSFDCQQERKTFLGVGGHAFALELNGRMIYDFRRRGLGNDFDPVSTKDHIIPVTFKKGKNILVARSCRTNWLLDFCYGKNRRIKWHFTIAELKDHVPPKAKLAANEIILRPTETSAVFSFITTTPVPAGIDHRISGTKKWIRQWDLAGEVVLRNDKKNHIIRLENLKPDTCYEYRIVLLEPPADGEKRSLWTPRVHKEVFTPVKEFRTPGAKEINFFVFGDTQLSLSANCQTVAHRDAFMKKMRALPQYKKANFVCHIGDMTSYFHSIEKDLFKDFFHKFFIPQKIKPWVYVRGNHELNGIDAARWHDFFVMPDEKPYYSFKVRDTLFIVLASGDFVNKKNCFNASNGPLLDVQTMAKKQSKWVKKLAKSTEFKKAKYRIVLSHIAPQLGKSQVIDEIREIAEPIMDDIHFWIGGHSHYYWRMFKGSETLYARSEWKKAPNYRKAKFNWVTLDGPKSSNAFPDFCYLSVTVNAKGIRAEVVDENGKLMDLFTIDAQGNAKELKRGKEITPYQLPR